MLAPEVLLTNVTEVAIGIAGFSGVVIAVMRGEQTETRRMLITGLLVTSIMTVFFAFLPMVMLSAGMAEETIWSVCGGLFAVYFFVMSFVRLKRIPFKQWPPIGKITYPMVTPFVLLQIVNIYNLQAAWPYLSLIVAYIFFSFSMFVALLFDLWQPQETSRANDGDRT